jgi:hypothetical protein
MEKTDLASARRRMNSTNKRTAKRAKKVIQDAKRRNKGLK